MELDTSSAPDRAPWGPQSSCPWPGLQWCGQQHLLWLPEMVRGRLPGQPCDSLGWAAAPASSTRGPFKSDRGVGGLSDHIGGGPGRGLSLRLREGKCPSEGNGRQGHFDTLLKPQSHPAPEPHPLLPQDPNFTPPPPAQQGVGSWGRTPVTKGNPKSPGRVLLTGEQASGGWPEVETT